MRRRSVLQKEISFGMKREKKTNRIGLMVLSVGIALCLVGCGTFAGTNPAGEENTSKEGSFSESGDSSIKENSFGTGSSSAGTEDGLMQSLSAAVQIFADNHHGSGVIYGQKDDGIVVVTAAHVIPSDCQKIKIVFRDGEEAVCTEYRLIEEADCAFLTIKEEIQPLDCQEKYGIVKKDREVFDAIQSEEGVFMVDYEAENDLGCRFAMVIENWIYVEDFGTHMMLVSGEAHSGMSGCGVFEENGCFLGILCGANDKGELAVLPYSRIETEFTKLLG